MDAWWWWCGCCWVGTGWCCSAGMVYAAVKLSSGLIFFGSLSTVEVRWGECIITGVCTFCSRFIQTASLLLQLFSSAREKNFLKLLVFYWTHAMAIIICGRWQGMLAINIKVPGRISVPYWLRHIVEWLTFRQFSFASCSWLGLLTSDGGPPTADPTDDRHGIIIPSSLQGVPVGDEGQPAVLSLQSHLKRHESLQVHVTVEVRMTTVSTFFESLISSVLTTSSQH